MSIKLSYSKLNTFKECPQKYYLQKKCPIQLNNSAVRFGDVLESGIDVMLNGGSFKDSLKLFYSEWHTKTMDRFSKKPIPIFDCPDITYYTSDFDKNLLTGKDVKQIEAWKQELMPKSENDWKKLVDIFQSLIKEDKKVNKNHRKLVHRIYWLCCKNRGKYMLRAFKQQLMPNIKKVHAMQKRINIKNDAGDQITGFIDYIFELEGIDGLIIIDLKSAGKYYTSHELETSEQLKLYAHIEQIYNVGYMVLQKKMKMTKSCDKCGHVAEKNTLKNCAKCGKTDKGKYTNLKLDADTQLLTRKVTEEELEDLMEDSSDIFDAIEKEIRWKNPSACFNFNKRCDYYDVCWNGKSIEELKKELERKKNV